jgi:ketosteroid isomerase-like protein
MSEENVALARKAIDALNRGDFDALLAFLSPDVVWEALEGVAGIGELYRGRAGVRERLARSSVQLSGDLVKALLADPLEALALREVLPQEAVGVLV